MCNNLYSNKFNPVYQNDATPKESYFYKVTEGDTFKYGELDLAIKQAREIALKSIVEFSFEEQIEIKVELHSEGTGFVETKQTFNPLEMSLEIAKLTIEIHKLQTFPIFDWIEEEKLNELKKQLTKIIEG